jgi:hypothetical protein
VLAHRIVWSCVALLGDPRLAVAAARGRWRVDTAGRAALFRRAILIGVNWYLYVWAVGHDLVVETSLGYYITPLVNVLLGVAVLGERLRPTKWIAVGLAAIGVAILTLAYGAPPRIALALAASFGTYGLVKKTAPLPPLEGLTLETVLLGCRRPRTSSPPTVRNGRVLHGAGGHQSVPHRRRAGDDRPAAAVCVGGAIGAALDDGDCCSSSRRRSSSCSRSPCTTSRSDGRAWPVSSPCGWP